jgi:hypothetical protein
MGVEMRPVANQKPPIEPGMYIRLTPGQNTILGRCTRQYNWDVFLQVDHLEGSIIKFTGHPDIDWYTTNMDWEIK